MYKKIFVKVAPIQDCLAEKKLSVEYDEENYRQLSREEILGQFKGLKKKVVSLVLDGENFYQISKKLKVDKNKIYAMRDKLKDDLAWVYDEAKKKRYLEVAGGELDNLIKTLKVKSKKLSLSQFAQIYINDYNPEAEYNDWKIVPLQDTYYHIWQNNSKSCIKAPREHLKTTSACEYLIKRLYERDYALDIVYLHKSKDVAIEKLRDIQMMIERNLLLSTAMKIDQAKNWKDGEIRLLDGSTIYVNAYGASLIGRHPHIIVLDDIIDQEIIFSDLKNDKAIRKFYSEIYPMITSAGSDKKIIVIGTAQREDDIYENLPSDFITKTLRAVVDEDKKEILEPNLFTWETLMKVKADMCEKFGEKYWLKEYMNMPFSAVGEIISPDWIKTYTTPPPLEELMIYQGWDLGVGKDLEKGDYTAGATIGVRRLDGKNEIYVLDVVKVRAEFGDRLKIMSANAQSHKPVAMGVESNVFQYDTVITLQKQTNLPIKPIKTVRNKVEKFQVALAPHFENGKVFIRADMLDFKQELLSLPYGKHDDQSDALTLAIQMSSEYGGEPIIDFL
ncbi:MAG: hypothetical protein RBQ97_10470 [Acholeplasma sp.]|nr:hypothetical protein [Acholeplasma sp.]